MVSLVNHLELLEELKEKWEKIWLRFMSTLQRRERYRYRVRDWDMEINFIDVDTTTIPDISFSKIINHLNKLQKL